MKPNRRAIEDAIERLIAILDAIDGDVDLEPEEEDTCRSDAEPFFNPKLGIGHVEEASTPDSIPYVVIGPDGRRYCVEPVAATCGQRG